VKIRWHWVVARHPDGWRPTLPAARETGDGRRARRWRQMVARLQKGFRRAPLWAAGMHVSDEVKLSAIRAPSTENTTPVGPYKDPPQGKHGWDQSFLDVPEVIRGCRDLGAVFFPGFRDGVCAGVRRAAVPDLVSEFLAAAETFVQRPNQGPRTSGSGWGRISLAQATIEGAASWMHTQFDRYAEARPLITKSSAGSACRPRTGSVFWSLLLVTDGVPGRPIWRSAPGSHRITIFAMRFYVFLMLAIGKILGFGL